MALSFWCGKAPSSSDCLVLAHLVRQERLNSIKTRATMSALRCDRSWKIPRIFPPRVSKLSLQPRFLSGVTSPCVMHVSALRARYKTVRMRGLQIHPGLEMKVSNVSAAHGHRPATQQPQVPLCDGKLTPPLYVCEKKRYSSKKAMLEKGTADAQVVTVGTKKAIHGVPHASIRGEVYGGSTLESTTVVGGERGRPARAFVLSSLFSRTAVHTYL